MSLAQQSQIWYPTHVSVTVLQARCLRGKGKGGTSDAYAIIQIGKEKYSTSVVEKSTSPLWKEEASFELPLLHQGNQERNTLYVIVMHRALVGLDKFLGQAVINLWELYENKSRNKIEWYKLKSKPGKKEKERGQVEVDIQFKRNNMTASLFDLSMKEKSRSPFGKLKDKIKGKHKDGLPDTASAIVPSSGQVMTDSDEEHTETVNKKKKPKIKSLFSKPNLKKNSLSQSMSVLPTSQPLSSVPEKNSSKTGSNSSSLNEEPSSPAMQKKSSNKLHLPKIMTHKRTLSVEPSLGQISPTSAKKESTSQLGLKSSTDPASQSNLCINGSHVYVEESESVQENVLKSSDSNDSLQKIKNTLSNSTEDLSPKKSEEHYKFNSSPILPFVKSQAVTVPSFKIVDSPQDFPNSISQDKTTLNEERNKPESTVFTSAVLTGKKEHDKSAQDSFEVLKKKDNIKLAEVSDEKAALEDAVNSASKKKSLNPFENDIVRNTKNEQPPTSVKSVAVKPRLDVSSEDETKAKLSSPVLDSPFLSTSFSIDPFINAPPIGRESDAVKEHHFASLHSSFAPPVSISRSSSVRSQQSLNDDTQNGEHSDIVPTTVPLYNVTSGSHSLAENSFTSAEKESTFSLLEKNKGLTEKQFGERDQVVSPFSTRTSEKTSTKSLLDELKRRKSKLDNDERYSYDEEFMIDKPVYKDTFSTPDYFYSQESSKEHNPSAASDKPIVSKNHSNNMNHEECASYSIPKAVLKIEESKDVTSSNFVLDAVSTKDSLNPYQPPKPAPRVLSCIPKEADIVDDPESIPRLATPTPAPRRISKLDKDMPAEEQSSFVSSTHAYGQSESSIPSGRMYDSNAGVSYESNASFLETSKDVVKPVTPSARHDSSGTMDVAVVKKDSQRKDVSHTAASFVDKQMHDNPFEDDISGILNTEVNANSLSNSSNVTVTKEAASTGNDFSTHLHNEEEGDLMQNAETFLPNSRAHNHTLSLGGLPVILEHAELTSEDEGLETRVETDEHVFTANNSQSEVSKDNTNSHTLFVNKEISPHSLGDQIYPSNRLEESSKKYCSATNSVKRQNLEYVDEELEATKGETVPRTIYTDATKSISEARKNKFNLENSELFDKGRMSPEGSETASFSDALSNPSVLTASPLFPHSDLLMNDKKESSKTAAEENYGEPEKPGKKKLLRAWVSPSETQPIQIQSGGTDSAKRRPHLVKPMNSENKAPLLSSSSNNLKKNAVADSALVTKSINYLSSVDESQINKKKYDSAEPAFAYAQLTHDELIQLVLKQKDTIEKKESHVRELEDYIDNLLVRIMDETPNILRVTDKLSKQSGRV
ncbi:rab11 family-interacting protein 1 [Protopterus annectens]|uniref:rab11 family-interacting protein 1 n=1 Tax=Protopterus annectens TaxID=7888 RepID=UPI001CFAC839|nr:rab11 family-interacting protein 1 [Protopterus annectens]